MWKHCLAAAYEPYCQDAVRGDGKKANFSASLTTKRRKLPFQIPHSNLIPLQKLPLKSSFSYHSLRVHSSLQPANENHLQRFTHPQSHPPPLRPPDRPHHRRLRGRVPLLARIVARGEDELGRVVCAISGVW